LDQAQEYINQAEQLHPSTVCAFLKFKIYLQKKDEETSVTQLQAMTSCHDFTSDFLTLSAHEAIASNALTVAIAALSNLLSLYSCGQVMSTPEVEVIRTLITILSQKSGNEPEILKVTKQARTRMFEVSPEKFLGKGEVGRRERNWFAATSWNIGTRMGTEKKYRLCAEFLQLASDFYGVTMGGDLEDNNAMVCKSLILSVSAMITLEKQDIASALLDSDVKQALKLLDRAGKVLQSISSGPQFGDDPTTIEPSFYFIYTLNAYDLQGRLSDTGHQQLILIKNFASSKMCTSQYLLQIGLNASQGPRANPDVAEYALNTCLSNLLSSVSPDYKTVALVMRKLIGLAGFKKGDADDEAYGMYKQAYQIMVGLKEGEFPSEEAKWLATTAWNRAALPVRLGQIDVAKKWMGIGRELSHNLDEKGKYTGLMEEFLTSFKQKFNDNDDG
ncbi:Tpr repeat-containing protein zip4, partial [Thalictrum thalictroides]